MNKHIGEKIKELRTKNKMTLKDLSEQTGLSIGFLSQLERGLTSIATDSLGKIADVLDVELSYFFIKPKVKKNTILRSYEKEVFDISTSGYIEYNLSNNLKNKQIIPRLIEIVPNNTNEMIQTFVHEGEEFIYILEGTLTLFLNEEQYELYPGDSVHYSSLYSHNWANYTNKMVKILVVATPNPFEE